jgi:hypothetical protein
MTPHRPPGRDGFGAYKEHREPRHGEFPAATGPWMKCLLLYRSNSLRGIANTLTELVEVL